MTYTEQALCFPCEGETLLGVLALPARPAPLGVLLIVGGPQYRVGSHRQYVQLARALAAGGFAALRFDCRGMGDSSGEPAGFESLDADAGAAVTALLRASPALRGVVLCGLCDGASAALMYLQRRGPDARIAGLCLLNPWVRTAEGEASTRVRHYYFERLRSAAFWRKLFAGGVARSAPVEALAALRRMLHAARARNDDRGDAGAPLHFTERMARGAASFTGPLLLVTSGRDYTAKEFLLMAGGDARWRQVMARVSTRRIDLPEADHTFSTATDRRALEESCVDWLRAIQGAEAAQAALAA